jgi:hypothetical protein
LKCFCPAKIENYYDLLYQGEKTHGRFIFLEESGTDTITLTFSRFINQVTSRKSKIIGFKITGKKEKIFKIML